MQVASVPETRDEGRHWRAVLSRRLGLLAGVLAAAALIFWIAANWPRLGPSVRLWLVAGAVAIATILAADACWRRSRWTDLLAGLAALATGALLALTGQMYQIDANSWSLYGTWALLILPWLLVLRTVFLTLLWAALLNLALWAYADQHVHLLFSTARLGDATSLALALLNAVLLGLAESLRPAWRDRHRLVPRVLAAALLVFVFAAAGRWVFENSSAQATAVALFAGLFAFLVLYGVYRTVRPDLSIVALAVLAAIGLLAAWAVRWLDSLTGLFFLALSLFVLGVLAIRHLLRLYRTAGRSDATGANDRLQDRAARGGTVDGEPWYLSVLRVGVLLPVVALFAAWLLIGLDLYLAEGAIGLGIALLLMGLGLERGVARPLGREVSGVLDLVGLVLVFGGVVVLMDDDYARSEQLVVILAAGMSTYVFSRLSMVRFLAALFTLSAVFWVLIPGGLFGIEMGSSSDWVTESSLRVAVCLYLGAGAWVLSTHPAWRATVRPLAWALLLLAAGPVVWPDQIDRATVLHWPSVARAVLLACALLPAALSALWLCHRSAASVPRPWRVGLPAVLCLATLAWAPAPGVSVSLVLLLLGTWSATRTLQALAVVVGLGGLGLYYLQPEPALLVKAGSFALAALGLMGVAATLARHRAPASAGPALRPRRASRGAPLAMVAGGILVLALAQGQVRHYDHILATGQRVVLALAPVDPRSLLSGDYMALHYAVQDEVRQFLRSGRGDWLADRRAAGWLVLRPDETGVSRLVRLSRHKPDLRADEVALAFRLDGMQPVFGATTWFFPEGQDAHYEAARYGVLKVSGEGRALLAGLLDGARQPL